MPIEPYVDRGKATDSWTGSEKVRQVRCVQESKVKFSISQGSAYHEGGFHTREEDCLALTGLFGKKTQI